MNRNYRKYSMFLNYKCNLNCSYCFESHKSNDILSFDIFKQNLDFIIKESKKDNHKPILIWYGGEPSINYKEMISYIEYTNSKMNNVTIYIMTNGINLPIELLEFLKINTNCELVISIDGCRETHNKNRSNTFDHIIDSIILLERHNIRYHGAKTLIREDIPYLFKDFLFLINTFDSIKIRKECDFIYWDKEDAILYENQMKKIINYTSQHPEKNIKLTNKILYKDRCIEHHCHEHPRDGTFYAIDIDGSIYPCEPCAYKKCLKLGDTKNGFNDFFYNEIKPLTKDSFVKKLNYNGGTCILYNYIKNGNILDNTNLYTPDIDIACSKLLEYDKRLSIMKGL